MKFKKEAIESEKDSEHDGTRSEGGRPSKRQRTDQETRNLAVEIQTTNEQDETNPDEVNFEAPKFNFKGDIFTVTLEQLIVLRELIINCTERAHY